MHPLLLGALVGVVAFVAGAVVGGMSICRLHRDEDDLSIPLWASARAQTVFVALRMLRGSGEEKTIEYLEQRLDLDFKILVQRLQEHPRALREEQFRILLGRFAEYRMAHPSAEPSPDFAPECQLENGEAVRLWPSLNEALTFARKHGMINLARP